MAQGQGVLQWFVDGKAGSLYEGEYRGGKQNGRGVYTQANGNRYDGEWKEGKRNGRGVFAFADGSTYDGEFKDDKPNGRGTLVQGEKTYSGIWTNGCYREDDRLAVVGTTRKECGFE